MPSPTSSEWPEEGDLVVCTLTTVRKNGAHANLDEYEGKEGWIFIGEIAAGWVKTIRNHVREGQRVVCKVLRVKPEKNSVSLSLKQVSEERKRHAIRTWKNEQKAKRLLDIVGDRVGWEKGVDSTELAESLTESFGSLYSAFEEAASEEGALGAADFEGDWIPTFIEVAKENVIPAFVTLRGQLEIEFPQPNGIKHLKELLLAIEGFENQDKKVMVGTYYDGAPRYRLEVEAPDYQLAESTWGSISNLVDESQSTGKVILTRE